MKKNLSIMVLALMMLLSACGSSSKSYSSRDANKETGISNEKASYNESECTDITSARAQEEKKIIVTYSIDMQCSSVNQASQDIKNKAESMGGYIQSEDMGESYGCTVVRIPSKEGDSFVDFIKESFEIEHTAKSSEDITDAYVDNDARLTNLKAEEAQILEIMKKAETVDEILSVQNRLYDVRAEVESLEALKKSWDNDVSYSTVNITMRCKAIITDSGRKVIGWSDFLKAIGQGFINSATGLLIAIERIVIFIISNIIILLIITAAAYGLYRKTRKKKQYKE